MSESESDRQNTPTTVHNIYRLSIFIYIIFLLYSPSGITAADLSYVTLTAAFQECVSQPIVQGPFEPGMWYAGCSGSSASPSSSPHAILQVYNEKSDEWIPILGPHTKSELSDETGLFGIVNFIAAEIIAPHEAFGFHAAKLKNKKQKEKRQHPQPPTRHVYLIGERPCPEHATGVDCEPVRSLFILQNKRNTNEKDRPENELLRLNQLTILQTRSDCGLQSISPPLVWSTLRQSLFSVCSLSGSVMAVVNGGSKITYHLGYDSEAHCIADNIALGSKQDVLYLSCTLDPHSYPSSLPSYIAAWSLDHGLLVRLQPAKSRLPPIGERWTLFVPPIRPRRDAIKEPPQVYPSCSSHMHMHPPTTGAVGVKHVQVSAAISKHLPWDEVDFTDNSLIHMEPFYSTNFPTIC